MSRLTKYIKRGVQYMLHGQPIVVVTPQIAILAPCELLKGRTALITGGTRGIGKAIAEAFLNAGANVIITSRSQENVDAVVRDLSSRYSTQYVYGVAMDNSDTKRIKDIFVQITQTIPHKIDILVNNAGILGGNFGKTAIDEFSKIVDVNLKGVFFLSECVVEYMKSNGIAGNILMIASSSSLRPAVSAYTISKWGLRGFTLGLAKICAQYGITVNGIAPGPTATEMVGVNNISDIYRDASPIKRYSLPEEIANMAVMLCSDMGRSVVGDIVYMTGGAGLITLDDVVYKF